MGYSNKTVALFFFVFSLNLLLSSLVAAHHDPTATPPPPTPQGTASPDARPIARSGTPSPPTGGARTCPLDTLSLGACANLLNGGVPVRIGRPVGPCCTLLQGLVDVDAIACLCTAIKAGPVRAINLGLPLILTACGRNASNAQCS